MIRLQMYLPNALRKGVFESLPYPPSFNWFFFGKKFFKEKRSLLEIDQPSQFFSDTTGESYEVKEPLTFLIALEKENRSGLRDLCKKEGFAGYAYHRSHVPVSMEPPVPCDVVFWVFPDAVTPVTDWKKCNILKYAAREPGNSWKDVRDLVARVGIERASLMNVGK